MTASWFEILVSDRTVTGNFGRIASAPTEPTEVDLAIDDLALDTVELMERWLNFWRVIISRAEIPHRETLFERKTFEVMGRQLWSLILGNDVGMSLARHLDNQDELPLRLVLTFTNRADPRVRGLPWEFLYHSRHGFLAGKTGMLLTRDVYLEESDSRPTVTPVQNDQLRVLLLAALPDERPFAAEREDLQKLYERLAAIDQLAPLEPIKSWDTESVRKALSDPIKPCHIVHVVGICKGPPGNPRLYLGGGGDGYQDPQELVERLTTGSEVPQLVILQLCDVKDGDASENFERLAPALVEKGVPAVLALQYAAPADEVGVGAAFYRSLIEGMPVGAAVQASREHLAKHVDRRFATPVLYLGNDGPLWKPPEPLGRSSQRGATTGKKGRQPGVKARMRGLVQRLASLDARHTATLLDWVDGLNLAEHDTEAARQAVVHAIKEGVDDQTLNAYTAMLRELTQKGKPRP